MDVSIGKQVFFLLPARKLRSFSNYLIKSVLLRIADVFHFQEIQVVHFIDSSRAYVLFLRIIELQKVTAFPKLPFISEDFQNNSKDLSSFQNSS